MALHEKSATLIRTGLRSKLPRGFSHPVGAELISQALVGVPQFDQLWIAFGDRPLPMGPTAPPEMGGLLKTFYVVYNHASGGTWYLNVSAVPSVSRSVVRRLLVTYGLPVSRAWLLQPRPETWYGGFRVFAVGCSVDPPLVCQVETVNDRLVASSVQEVP